MLAAIIDDGVYEGFYKTPRILAHLEVDAHGMTVPEIGRAPYPSHGTLCAAAIESLCPGTAFISLRILDEHGRGPIDKLQAALIWCAEKDVKLIHMSMGTANYDDVSELELAVRQLTAQGALLVAAYHNRNIPTWPAICKGVFGVRQDRCGLLKNGSFLFDYPRFTHPENAFVARFDQALTGLDGHSVSTGIANSFAAPVITALLCAWLKERPELCFDDALKRFKDRAMPQSYPVDFWDYSRFASEEIRVPVVFVEGEALLCGLTRHFRADGYSPVALGDRQNEGVLAKSLYHAEKQVTLGLLAVLQKVYEPDILLISAKEGVDTSPEDLRVTARGILTQDGEKCCADLEEIYRAVVNWFQ